MFKCKKCKDMGFLRENRTIRSCPDCNCPVLPKFGQLIKDKNSKPKKPTWKKSTTNASFPIDQDDN